MKNRRFWWIGLVVVALIAAGSVLIWKKSTQKPVAVVAPMQPVEATSLPKEEFIDVVPITFHVGAMQTIDLNGEEAFAPRASPDGRHIVVVLKSQGQTRLGVVELPEGRVARLDLGFDDYADPSWSANGSQIIFAGTRQGVSEIYLCTATGEKLQQLTHDPARRKSWPRCSPFPFGDSHGRYFRIAYVSEENGRQDIWWVRDSGEYDQPITVSPQRADTYKNSPYWQENSAGGTPEPISVGGNEPEWSPSGNLLLYRTPQGPALLSYSYYDWWWRTTLPLPKTTGMLSWTPNQTAILSFSPDKLGAELIARDGKDRRQILEQYRLTSPPTFFPDGRGLAVTHQAGDVSQLAIVPHDDPLGDVANLWMYPLEGRQREQLAKNELVLRVGGKEQIYNLYDEEAYTIGDQARPYLVTSDAVLETYYAAFSSLYAVMERTRLATALREFASAGVEAARQLQSPPEVETYFSVGLALLEPQRAAAVSAEVRRELDNVIAAKGKNPSLFGIKINFADFFVRGKYERDTDLQGMFLTLKWFQAFSFPLDRPEDRPHVAELLRVAQAPKVHAALQNLAELYSALIGESRYVTPLNMKELPADGALPEISPTLPWIERVAVFQVFPPLYTLDAWIFDELITHTDRPASVGTIVNPRLFPRGLDIPAAFGSTEARRILLEELDEGRFERYAETLDATAEKIRHFSPDTLQGNHYQEWLSLLAALVAEPAANSPSFVKTAAWRRKNLNTALGSWVNLRYETIAMVEQVAAEAGEGGYEVLYIGKPRGYVEPNPEFFDRLDQAFAHIAKSFAASGIDAQLNAGVQEEIAGYRRHIQSLAGIARKELANQPLSDEENAEILHIGRIVEHFMLLIGSATGTDSDHALRNPEPVAKIVDVQRHPLSNDRLYEALGRVDEVNVAVPYFGRRQIVRGPIYTYYEFISGQPLDTDEWRKMTNPDRPTWLAPYYVEKKLDSLGRLPDLLLKP